MSKNFNIQENLNQLHALQIEFPQAVEEFAGLIGHVQELRPSVFVEIGTREGGSLWMLSQYLPDDATIISIDLVNGPWGRSGSRDKKIQVAADLRARGFEMHLMEMDSHAPQTVLALREVLAGRNVDCLFLDGDHSEAGVRCDWEMYAPFVSPGGIVAFHDVVLSEKTPRCRVGLLWNELKTVYRHEEYLHRHGIGVLWMSQQGTPGQGISQHRDVACHETPVSSFAKKSVKPDTFAYTSPYSGSWIEPLYGRQTENLFDSKVVRERDFREKLQNAVYLPELMLMHNFVVERAGIVSLCRELDINTVHVEDGFFPHYGGCQIFCVNGYCVR